MPNAEDMSYPHAGEDDLDKLRLLDQVKQLREHTADLTRERDTLAKALQERPRCPSCASGIKWEGGDLVCDSDEDCGWTASGHWGKTDAAD